MYKIRTMNAISPLGISILEKHGCAVKPDIENPEALLIRSADLHSTEFWPELLCIGRAGAGVNNIPLDTCSEKGIVVFNAPGANADATKEMVIFEMLLASRDILGSIEWVKSIADRGDEIPALVEKGKSAFAGPELCGKNLGVIGLGAIGALVANLALEFGMTVRGYDPYMSVESAWRLSRDVIHVDYLDEIFRTSDYISLNVPYTESTHHMIDADAIAAMRPGVRIMNESRAEIVDDDAMLAGLESGKVGKYVTDFPNKKLIGARNCITTPHLGACTPESEEKISRNGRAGDLRLPRQRQYPQQREHAQRLPRAHGRVPPLRHPPQRAEHDKQHPRPHQREEHQHRAHDKQAPRRLRLHDDRPRREGQRRDNRPDTEKPGRPESPRHMKKSPRPYGGGLMFP